MNWKQVHEQAMTLAQQFKFAQSELIGVLQEVDSNKIFRKLGFNSLCDYCLRQLKLSPSDADSLIRVARKSIEVPALKQAIHKGQVTLSAARRVCSVIDQANQAQWLSAATSLPQRELEKKVAETNPRAQVRDQIKPLAKQLSELRCAVSTEVEDLIHRVQDLESKRQKKNCTLEEVFQKMAILYLERNCPIEKATRIETRTIKRTLAAKTLEIEPSKLSTANVGEAPKKLNSKPATVSRPGKRRIPSKILHAVVLRDKNSCTHLDAAGIKCDQRRFTEIHHVRAFSHGGAHELSNLTTLCSTHHKGIHEQNPFASFLKLSAQVAGRQRASLNPLERNSSQRR